MKTGSAIFVTALLLLCSNESLSAAQQAAYGFWKSFLPAMLPFFLLSPYLTSPDAQAAFSRVFGRALQALLRIPGGGAGALLCALAAGTPAGAAACADAGRDMEADAYARLCCLCSGLSPAFTAGKMKELWFYMHTLFPDCAKPYKALTKARDLGQLRACASSLMSSCAFDPARGFQPPM